MRTNIVLDDVLINEAMHLAGVASKRETVDISLRELVARRRQQEILTLATQGLIAPDYDVRTVREGMDHGPG